MKPILFISVEAKAKALEFLNAGDTASAFQEAYGSSRPHFAHGMTQEDWKEQVFSSGTFYFNPLFGNVWPFALKQWARLNRTKALNPQFFDSLKELVLQGEFDSFCEEMGRSIICHLGDYQGDWGYSCKVEVFGAIEGHRTFYFDLVSEALAFIANCQDQSEKQGLEQVFQEYAKASQEVVKASR